MSTELELSGRYARLQREREDGERAFNRGAALLISAPVSLMGGLLFVRWLDTFAPLFIAAMYCIIALSAGVAMIGVGMVQSRSANRRLAALEADRLPAARLLR
ncbi:MAG: hypothetical protein ABI678_32020 [Kofleriaceae bacterium]